MAEPDPVFDVRYAPTPADRERVNALKAALTARFLADARPTTPAQVDAWGALLMATSKRRAAAFLALPE
jgi:hypothetical protein